MTKVASLNYEVVVRTLQRPDWVAVRQRGWHTGLPKHLPEETLKITIPAHRPIPRSTLSQFFKDARLSVEEFVDLA